MRLSDFDFDLPPRLIAQHPLADRSGSRLLHVHEDALDDLRFTALPELLRAGDLLVMNDTRVIRARLLGVKADTGGQVEALIERIDVALDIARGRQAALQDGERRRARFDRLTAREMEIVERIVERPSETSSKEIALYLGISPRTVDHHRARILEKLGLKSIVELIAVAKG